MPPMPCPVSSFYAVNFFLRAMITRFKLISYTSYFSEQIMSINVAQYNKQKILEH